MKRLTYIRIFHLFVGTLLMYIGLQNINGVKINRAWYILLVILGGGAFAYHGYNLLKQSS